MRKCSWYTLWVVLTCVALGCGPGQQGPPRGAVRGTVQLDQIPIEQGYITFTPIRDTQGQAVSAMIVDGDYSLSKSKGPMVGWNRVQISSKGKTGNKIEAGSPHPPGTMIDEIAEVIPMRYNMESTLEQEVESAKNVADFSLTSE